MIRFKHKKMCLSVCLNGADKAPNILVSQKTLYNKSKMPENLLESIQIIETRVSRVAFLTCTLFQGTIIIRVRKMWINRPPKNSYHNPVRCVVPTPTWIIQLTSLATNRPHLFKMVTVVLQTDIEASKRFETIVMNIYTFGVRYVGLDSRACMAEVVHSAGSCSFTHRGTEFN